MQARSYVLTALGLVLLAGVWVGLNGCDNKPKPPVSTKPIEADLAVSSPLEPKTPKPLDLSYIPPEAVFAAVLDPYQLTNSPQFPLINSGNLPALIATDLGVDLAATEQAIIIGGLGKKLGEYFAGTILRYKNPVDLQAFLHARYPEWEEVAEGDRKYYRPKDEQLQSVCLADSKTILSASESTLKLMLAASKDAESPLLTTLKKADDAAAALVVLEVAQIRPQIMAFLVFTKLPSPFDAPPYNGVKEVPKNIDEAIIKFEVIPTTNLTAELRAKDEEGAVATDTFIANVIDKVADMLSESMDEPGPDSNQRANAQAMAMQNLFGTFKDQFKHSREGKVVQLKTGGLKLQNQLIMVAPPVMRPYVQSWDKSQVDRSRENMMKVGAALADVAAAKGAYPAPASYGPDGKPLLSWRVHLLPALGQQALYDEFHLDEPWDSEHNKQLIPRMPMVYRTPSHLYDGKTQYLLPTGAGSLFEGTDGPKPDAITDGKGKTIALVEVYEGRGIPWTKPDDLKFDRADPTVNLTNLAQFTFEAAFADGTVHTVDAKKHAAIVSALFSPAGGEEVPDEL